jgi:glycosyltransferase involved in cell wall biosynthesis
VHFESPQALAWWRDAGMVCEMRRIKVLHLITTLPRLSGAADNTRYTVNLLNPDRYEVHLASGPAEFDGSGVLPHIRVILIDSLVRPVAFASDLLACWQLCRMIRNERYDIVHTHNAKAGVLGRVAAKLMGVPVIVHTAHSISFVASTSQIANWIYRLADMICARITNKIITVASLNTNTYLDAGIGTPGQYVTIYSGVEIQKYLDRSERVACRAELGVNSGEMLVSWFGRLNRQKDPVTFVRAAQILIRWFPSIRAVMVGEDPLGDSVESEVRRAIEELQVGSKLRFLGYRPDVHRILAASDLVMHTSLYEGLGRTVVETMLSGTPIVATAVDGVREAVISGERGGFLVPPGNPAALAAAGKRLIEAPELGQRLAAAGRSWALQRFDVQDMVKSIDMLYQQLWQHQHLMRHS